MLENIQLGVMMLFGAVGLVLMCASLVQIKRHGFQKAVAEKSEGKLPLGSYLFYGALTCFAVALAISFFD